MDFINDLFAMISKLIEDIFAVIRGMFDTPTPMN